MKLSEVRKKEGLTQLELAARAGVSPSTVARAEQGKLPCSLRILSKICKSLGTTTESVEGLNILENSRNGMVNA